MCKSRIFIPLNKPDGKGRTVAVVNTTSSGSVGQYDFHSAIVVQFAIPQVHEDYNQFSEIFTVSIN